MTEYRDPDRLIHAFLMEGEEYMQDRVYDEVRADIEQKRQRAVIGPWRLPIMNKLVPIGLGAAAMVAVLLVGPQLLGPSTPGGVGGAPSAEPSAAPSPTASATPEPSVASTSPDPSSYSFVVDSMRFTVTIPDSGWFRDGGVIVRNDAEPPDGAGMIEFASDLYVYGDPCRWTTTRSDTPATTVDELVAALSAQASRDATAPVDVEVGGYAGKSISLHVPVDADFSLCDEGKFGSWGVPGDDPARYHQGPGQIDQLWILDVDGVLTVIDAAYYEGTPVEDVDALRAMVGSMTFELR